MQTRGNQAGSSRIRRHLKRWLFLAHRWTGGALSLVLAVWFASGLVMMYRGYPSLTAAERLAALPPLDLAAVRLSPADLAQHQGFAAPPTQARLQMAGATPVYRLLFEGHGWRAFDATTGAVLDTDERAARQVVAAFLGQVPEVRRVARLERADQWTLSSGLAAHFPLWRFDLADPARTRLYLSQALEVVHASTGSERAWAWVGAIPHWIYPTALRRERELWRAVVIALSAVGVVVCASGLWIGLLRWRRRAQRAPGQGGSPHRGLLRWHHYGGLAFGVVSFTWVLSGLFSMNPGRWSQGSAPSEEAVQAFAGGPLELPRFTALPPAAAVGAVREVQLSRFAGAPFYLLTERPGQSTRWAAARPAASAEPPLEEPALRAAVAAAWPGARVLRATRLETYDRYYYDHRHHFRPLPVLRIELDDAARTQVYVDPVAARIVAALDRTGRAERWLYHGLHSWDFGRFYAARPAWDLAMIPFLLGGSLLSGSGVWLTARWLGRRRRQWRARTQRRESEMREQRNRAAALVGCLLFWALGAGASEAPVERAEESPEATEVAQAGVEESIEVRGRTSLDAATSTGSRVGLSLRQTPASLEVVDGEALRRRGDWTGIEAVTRATGIASSPTGGNGGTALSARGFVGHGSVMQLYDGSRLYVGAGTLTFPVDTWGFERIEVLRGPASVLYGEGAIGGAINYVSRRPSSQADRRLALTAGTEGSYRLGLATSGPLGETLQYKVDLSGYRTDGVVDHGGVERGVGSAALAWQPRPGLSLSLDYDRSSLDEAPYWGTPLIAGRIDRRTRERNYNIEDGEIRYDDSWIRQRTVWEAGDGWVLENELYHLTSDRHWRNVENYVFVPETGRIGRDGPLEIFHDQRQTGNRFLVRANGQLAGPANRWVAGFDVNAIDFEHTNNAPFRLPTGVSLAVDPFDFDPGRFLAADPTAPGFVTETEQASFFLEDSLELSRRVRLVASLRHERIDFERTDQRNAAQSFARDFTATTWRLGGVFEATPSLAVYGQVGTAVDPLGSLITTSFFQRDFDLARGRQAELGLKQSLPGRRGEWTLAAYRIEKTNLLTRDPANPALTLQIGEQSSTGVEAWLRLGLGARWTIEANGAWLDARFDDFVESVGGVAVSRAGKTPTQVPERLANLWLSWQPQPAWELGAGLRYVGRRFANTANTLELPEVTTLDAFAAWQLSAALGLTVRGRNLTDEVYALAPYNGGTQWVLGAPRGFEVTLATRF